MPKQQKFLEFRSGSAKVSVLKSYDRHFAREVFGQMDDTARVHLARSLDVDELDSKFLEDGFWDELVDRSREDWNRFSFFIVRKRESKRSTDLYVSPDWPSAEQFARGLQLFT